jgi:hypothetical protein
MSPDATNKMFLSAAICNWIVALGLFFIPELFLSAFFVTPTPGQSIWVQQFAGLVFVFGIGYYWASRDFHYNRAIVKLAVWGKWGVVLIAALNILSGDISWQFIVPASADGVFAILFTLALKSSSRSRLSSQHH